MGRKVKIIPDSVPFSFKHDEYAKEIESLFPNKFWKNGGNLLGKHLDQTLIYEIKLALKEFLKQSKKNNEARYLTENFAELNRFRNALEELTKSYQALISLDKSSENPPKKEPKRIHKGLYYIPATSPAFVRETIRNHLDCEYFRYDIDIHNLLERLIFAAEPFEAKYQSIVKSKKPETDIVSALIQTVINILNDSNFFVPKTRTKIEDEHDYPNTHKFLYKVLEQLNGYTTIPKSIDSLQVLIQKLPQEAK